MQIDKYLEDIVNNSLDKDFWFITKQTLSDFYLPFFIARIVDSYNSETGTKDSFDKYYVQKFLDDEEASEKYKAQTSSLNTYRNTIIPEYFGLTTRESSRGYKSAEVTNAYYTLAKYIKKHSDVVNYRTFVDHQLEKLCVNVNTNARKYKDVESVTIFMVVFLYKVLYLLNKKYGSSKLNYDEFLLFVFRSKSYEDIDNVIDLIGQYRTIELSEKSKNYRDLIVNSKASENIRFKELLGSLTPIKYVSNSSYEIIDEKSCYDYIETVIELYEKSIWRTCKDKDEIVDFMCSKKYFFGTIDCDIVSLDIDDSLLEKGKISKRSSKKVRKERSTKAKRTYEQIQRTLTSEEIDKLLDKLCLEYGTTGTKDTNVTVRLPEVQKIFRDELINHYGQKCLMCDISNHELLVAGHIQRSANCDIFGKAAKENGFLMCTIHDSLFDKFFITFDCKTGEIIISDTLNEYYLQQYNIDRNFVLPHFLMNEERSKYLKWHNDKFYEKEKNRLRVEKGN